MEPVKSHVAILPSPGMGHLIPVGEFAKRLVVEHGFAVTILTYSDFSSQSQRAFLSSLPAGLSSLSLPPVPGLGDLPADTPMETRLSLIVARSVPAIRSALRSLSPLAALVVDLFGGDTFPAAKELGIPHYMFFTSNLFMLSFMFHLPTLHATTSCQYRHLPEPLRLPGCPPLRGEDFLHPLYDRSDPVYPWIVHMARRFREAEGILANTFEAMEPEAAKVLTTGNSGGRPPVYPVGPVVQRLSAEGESKEWREWLDKQVAGSVVYVSFGSGGTISAEQTRELALGLELSGQRFLWVARPPNDQEAGGVFFGDGRTNGDGGRLGFLPEGFLERTREAGLVVPMWAPQVQVLGHAATGGFVSHCGWNSTLESAVRGVPMVAWPLYAEQRMNAVLLAEGVGVALRPGTTAVGKVVEREEVARVVRELMEGEKGKKVRERASELKAAAVAAVGEGGSSYRKFAEVAGKWKDCYYSSSRK